MNWIIGIILLILLLLFAFFGGVSIRHAARFRYLSGRTVYLSLLFVAVSSILILLILGSYLGLILN